jgi:hypothetical protein
VRSSLRSSTEQRRLESLNWNPNEARCHTERFLKKCSIGSLPRGVRSCDLAASESTILCSLAATVIAAER